MAVASTLAWRLAWVRRSAPELLARHHRQPIAPPSQARRSIVAGDIQQACSLHKMIQTSISKSVHKNIPLVLTMRYATTGALAKPHFSATRMISLVMGSGWADCKEFTAGMLETIRKINDRSKKYGLRP